LRDQTKQQYNERLKKLFAHRYDAFQDEYLDCQDADLIPLNLQANDEFLESLTGKEEPDGRKKDTRQPITLEQVLRGKVAGKGLSFIVGPPGSGKTTLLYHLGRRMAEENEEVVVLVHAEKLTENLHDGYHSPEIIVESLAASAPTLLDEVATNQLKVLMTYEDQPLPLTILVDGLDEIRSAERVKLLDRLLQLKSRVSICRRIIVCSRPGAFVNLKADRSQFAAVMRVMPLDSERSAKLAQILMSRWGEAGKDIIRRVQEAARSSFQGSPLLVYMICKLAKDKKTVANNEVELYKGVLGLLFDRAECKDTKGRITASTNSLRELSSLAAYVIHTLGYSSDSSLCVDRAAVESKLTDVLSSSEEGEEWKRYNFPEMRKETTLLHEVLEDFAGVLCQQSKTSFAMLHRTLQEFLVAQLLTIESNHKNKRLLALRDVLVSGGDAAGSLGAFSWSNGAFICGDWWSEVFRFAGLIRGPRWLAQQILGAPKDPTAFDKWLSTIKENGMDKEDIMLKRLWHTVRACCGGLTSDEVAGSVVEALLAVFTKDPEHYVYTTTTECRSNQ